MHTEQQQMLGEDGEIVTMVEGHLKDDIQFNEDFDDQNADIVYDEHQPLTTFGGSVAATITTTLTNGGDSEDVHSQWKHDRWHTLHQNDNNNSVVIVLVDDKPSSMICKEGTIDVISIGGSQHSNGSNSQPHQMQQQQQNRRKSQMITFSSSSCDIKNSLSHEVILVNSFTSANAKMDRRSSTNGRSSIAGNSINNGSTINGRHSYAEENVLLVQNCERPRSGSGSGSGAEADLDDDVFRRRSLEVDEDFDCEYETNLEVNNANDDSGGGSYEDSNPIQSSTGGSNRNSLEKDDDEIDIDVISTDVSCYDQLLGTRNDDDVTTIVGDGDIIKIKNGGIGTNGEGIIYANPFLGL